MISERFRQGCWKALGEKRLRISVRNPIGPALALPVEKPEKSA